MMRKTGELSTSVLDGFRERFEARAENRVAMNAATRGDLEEISLNRRVLDGIDWSFSHEVAVGGITAQKQAGTCWLYAGLNWLRKITMKKMKVEGGFQFSQNYLVFWDQLEKCNRFLERMIDLRDRSIEDRTVHWYLTNPVSDGGDWVLLRDLIEKYGLVPQTAMADTSNLGNSAFKNQILSYKLREGASLIRARAAAGAEIDELHALKLERMEEIWRILCILFGEPPAKFDWSFRDKKGKFHRHTGLTPHDFFHRWVGVKVRDYLHLVSSPLPSTPYHRTYTIEGVRNIEGQPDGASLNVPVATVRELALKLLTKGEPVFFDCDVTQGLNRKLGMLDTELYDYGLLFDTRFGMDRVTRMEYFHERPTHCMVLVGVDLVGKQPVKWKIENSWGEDRGEKGLFQMSDRWFEEYVYGLTVHRKVLGPKLSKLFDAAPVALPPWHTLS